MKKMTWAVMASLSIILPVLAQQQVGQKYETLESVRFAPLHVYIDSGDEALAAYQFELRAVKGEIAIVGVEGGEHPAFNGEKPPYYDPAALMNNRIIIAAFNTGNNLPDGKTRIATIHLQIKGEIEPEYEVKLSVAVNKDGKAIPATVTLEQGGLK